ncbi:MAG: Rne/Rng family ribonuclease [Verrucomicrobiae bacterium]|nr:Rne/Rng family ribonuclease [Verrucomicrobiae bacterium]
MLKFIFNKRRASNKEIVINAEALEKRVALLENGRLEEFHIERTNEQRLVGSIFKGRIKNLEPGLKAAFVDIGYEKNAFLHYWDIIPESTETSFEAVETKGRRPREASPTAKRPTMDDIPRLYPPGTEVIVQVTKGSIGTKGPRITTDISLPGRYLVLNPFSDQSGISRKIEDSRERVRLREILRGMTVPEGMGVIFRTAGMGLSRRYFIRDLALLVEEWQKIAERIKVAPTPSIVFTEPGLVHRTVRDFLTEDIDRIIVDSPAEHDLIAELVGQVSTRSKAKVKLYDEPVPIFQRFGVDQQIEDAFKRQVWLKCGGYIVIDETEALVAIDVNTGRNTSGRDLERTILTTNLEAAEEVARQLRLRNIGGLIVIDFIDMKGRRDQQEVTHRLRESVRRDKAKTHILPISPLGLAEMTRQRQEESIRDAVFESCPNCRGRGVVKSAESMSVEIQRRISEILRKRRGHGEEMPIRVIVHPEVLERLRKHDEERLLEMEQRLSGKLSFRSDSAIHKEEFRVINPVNGAEFE